MKIGIGVPSEFDFVEARASLDTEDFKILSQDPKAMDLLEEADKIFRDGNRELLQLKKSNSSVQVYNYFCCFFNS